MYQGAHLLTLVVGFVSSNQGVLAEPVLEAHKVQSETHFLKLSVKLNFVEVRSNILFIILKIYVEFMTNLSLKRHHVERAMTLSLTTVGFYGCFTNSISHDFVYGGILW